MDDKSLKEKAVDIKGKQYVLVQDRVLYFNEHYPKGSIQTDYRYIEGPKPMFIVKATIEVPTEDKEDGKLFTRSRYFNGTSQAVIGDGMVNKTSALENAETSAVGRALAFMGIGVIESIASADEIHKATGHKSGGYDKPVAKPVPPAKVANTRDALKARIKELVDAKTLVEMTTGEDYKNYVRENCGLELVPDNFEAIIDALEEI